MTTHAEAGDAIANRAKEKTADEPKKTANLRSRYGAIGISAVAAAVRFSAVQKSSPYVAVEPGADERFA